MRVREVFKAKGEAETRAQEIHNQVENEGRAVFSIPTALRVEAVECAASLAPDGASIREACQWYEKHVLNYRDAPIVAEIVEKLIAGAVAAGSQETTTVDYALSQNTFLLSLHGQPHYQTFKPCSMLGI